MMKLFKAVFKREFNGYFNTPLAYVFTVIFIFLTGIFTFWMGGFYNRNQADLVPFFIWHPWLYLVYTCIQNFHFLTSELC